MIISDDLRFVDTREASRITGIPAATLTTWRSKGRDTFQGGDTTPPFFRLPNGRIRYEVASLVAWMRASGEMTSTANYAEVINGDSSASNNCMPVQSKTEETSA